MSRITAIAGPTRRSVLMTGCGGLVSVLVTTSPAMPAEDEAVAFVKRLTGKTAAISDRVRLDMPPVFPTGYTVPLTLAIDSPMTQSDHVRHVRVVAPKNPIIDVAVFTFASQRSIPLVSTRIRLAAPQYVIAFAEMNDGTLLMNKTWVDVATNGCA